VFNLYKHRQLGIRIAVYILCISRGSRGYLFDYVAKERIMKKIRAYAVGSLAVLCPVQTKWAHPAAGTSASAGIRDAFMSNNKILYDFEDITGKGPGGRAAHTGLSADGSWDSTINILFNRIIKSP
jgi:hypothetical protein